jgi:hypothetical protein
MRAQDPTIPVTMAHGVDCYMDEFCLIVRLNNEQLRAHRKRKTTASDIRMYIAGFRAVADFAMLSQAVRDSIQLADYSALPSATYLKQSTVIVWSIP